MAEPDFPPNAQSPISAAEEQPQQNDHRDRHAQQPKQNSSSHVRLLDPQMDSRTRSRTRSSGYQSGTKTSSGVTGAERSAEGRLAWLFARFHQLGIAAVFSGHLQELLAHFRIRDLAGQTFGLLGLKFVVLALAHGVPQILRRV